ncbi:MAG: hypothetical protein ABI811_22975 [Acidobacteriota bacterium]
MTPPVNERPFVSDGPEFAQLRPEIRQQISEAEFKFRAATDALIASYPPEIAGDLEPLGVIMHAGFFRVMLPFFVHLSTLMDLADEVRVEQKSMFLPRTEVQ